MKLGSLKEGGRDGTLIVASRDLRHGVRATGIAATLQQALEDWSHIAPRLNALYESLNAGDADGVFDLDPQALAAPMPRAYEFVDGSAYLPHVERVRRARGAEVPESFYTDPLMYQATSAGVYGPRDAVKVVSDKNGLALTFSRAPLPWARDAFAKDRNVLPEGVPYRRHIGMYAYRVGFLQDFVSWGPCWLEQTEALEQLRALWHGVRIHVEDAIEAPAVGVDTPEDLERVRRLLEA